MSIALERATCFPVYESPAFAKMAAAVAEEDDDVASCNSLIGRNSGGVNDGDEGEVQSSYKGALDTMDSLEDSLPMRYRRAISNFYCGKSKSYASLTDVLPLLSPTKDSCKPDNAYSRKRKNLLSFNLWEKKPNSQRSIGDIPVSKRLTNLSRTTTTTTTQGVDHSVSSSSGSNSFSNGTVEGYQDQSHYPYGKSIAQRRRVSLPTKPFLSADLEGVVSSTPSTAESVDKWRMSVSTQSILLDV